MLEEVIIIIPTYKNFDDLTLNEKKSFNQCCKVLKKHQICIIHPLSLEVSSYQKNLKNQLDYKILNKPFNNCFFSDVAGYNDLMLGVDFYTSFREYKYILIYQLDCWVFRDELWNWCNLNYDYIGAPMFNNFGTFEGGNELEIIGNGGFSLRKTDTFIKVLLWKGNIKNFKYFFTNLKNNLNFKNFFQLLFGIFGYHNRIKYLLDFYKKKSINEDVFFSYNFKLGSNIQIKVPDILLSIHFAFDRSPQYLYELTQNKLPFGCHGWNRQDTIYSKDDKTFWEQFINN